MILSHSVLGHADGSELSKWSWPWYLNPKPLGYQFNMLTTGMQCSLVDRPLGTLELMGSLH